MIWLASVEVLVQSPAQYSGLRTEGYCNCGIGHSFPLGFSPWPRNFHMLWVWPKKEKQKTKKKNKTKNPTISIWLAYPSTLTTNPVPTEAKEVHELWYPRLWIGKTIIQIAILLKFLHPLNFYISIYTYTHINNYLHICVHMYKTL